ncbi:hypothetical protein [Bordetella genomosp. 11]|uniref:Uncharacterized protein n=1 Tax=Bordetella genomosp. 11 TaxID=1416808 RepID=A0A261ULK4_9BORD|nr:hypothetical protein [Bordetella genomosp. 11]OZI62417.1 hypothetical protein CAL28_24870 [Bordetella genomosp. 11]
MTSPPLWNAADIQAHCDRYGLRLSEPMMRRMHELSSAVTRTGMAIPRMPSKEHEPAFVFDLPVASPNREEP